MDWSSLCHSTLLGFALSCAATDLAWRRIPNSVTFLAIPLGFVFHGLEAGRDGLFLAGAGAGLGLLVGWLHFSAGLMGAGDAKMLAGVGALFGPDGLIVASMCAAVMAGAYGFVCLLRRRTLRAGLTKAVGMLVGREMPSPRDPGLPFGAFLGLAVVGVLLWPGGKGL